MSSNVGLHRETCCLICDLRIGVIVLAITGMIESGQQILVSFALAVSHSSKFAEFPGSNVALLHVYTVFQIVSFISILFGLVCVVSQGRRYRKALLFWITSVVIISVTQIVYLFYIVAYFNRRIFSLIALTLVLCFVPKNAFFSIVVYKYYKLVLHGFISPDYDELDFSKETIRRSRAGSSRRESLLTLKDGPCTGLLDTYVRPDMEPKVGRKVSSSVFLKVIPELSESKDNSLESNEVPHEIFEIPNQV